MMTSWMKTFFTAAHGGAVGVKVIELSLAANGGIAAGKFDSHK